MKRVLIVAFAVVFFGSMAWVHSAQEGKKVTSNEGKAPAAARKEAGKPLSLSAKLAARINFDGFNDPKTTLQDALENLSDKFDVRFDVEEVAFKAALGDKSVLAEPIATTPIPQMKEVTLDTLIRKILARIPSQPGREPTYLLRGNTVLITTADYFVPRIWGEHYRGPRFPLVHPDIEEKGLDEVLKELAQASGHNIIVDKRLGPKAQVPVSIKMTNAPLDTVVRFLADMTDVDTVFLDNVIYVTTKENAETWSDKLQKEEAEEDPTRPRPRIGTVPLTPPGSTPPGA
jgi:hypothetical protein